MPAKVKSQAPASPGVRPLAVALLLVLAVPGCLDQLAGQGRVEPGDLVSARDYRRWHIEVDYAAGKQPSQALLSFLHDRLAPVVDKPDGIVLQFDEALTDTSRSWSAQAIVDYARQHKGTRGGDGTVATQLLFLSGHSDRDQGDSKVLGVAIGHDLVAIFVDQVGGMCAGAILPGTCSTAPFFRSVALHELGHSLGLVDNGLPMVRDHEDDAHQGHSSNRGSVMYWAVERSDLLGTLFGDSPPDSFDADDRADLERERTR
jgi:hypothetical protein